MMQTLTFLDTPLAICRLSPEAGLPAWATASEFFSVTRTPEELSIVCPESEVPEGTRADRGWRALVLEGPLDLSLTGVLASVSVPLAEATIPVFAISTHDTDYLLVRNERARDTATALTRHGHRVRLTNDKLTSVK